MKSFVSLACICLLPTVAFAQYPGYRFNTPANRQSMPLPPQSNRQESLAEPPPLGSPPAEETRDEALRRAASTAVVALEERLWDCNTDVRQAAIYALEALGPAAKPAIPAIAERMRDQDAYIRSDAARTLAELGPDSVASVVPLLQDCDPRVRELAAHVLEEIGGKITQRGNDEHLGG